MQQGQGERKANDRMERRNDMIKERSKTNMAQEDFFSVFLLQPKISLLLEGKWNLFNDSTSSMRYQTSICWVFPLL